MRTARPHVGNLHGGLRLAPHKAAATAQPIFRLPVPQSLVLPLHPALGGSAEPVVAIGEHVLKGQVIASCKDGRGVALHASSSGVVAAIENRPVVSSHGTEATCIVIDCDGEDRAIELPRIATDFHDLAPDEVLAMIAEGGIAGLGGALFPTGQKLRQARGRPLDLLLINGVECEPYISCDDALMREHAARVLAGVQILLHALSLDIAVIAIEADKREAIRAVAQAIDIAADTRIRLELVPVKYPSGGEDQLVQLLTGREVPSGGLPTDVGCIVQNVATVAAIHDWLEKREPLVSRITTIAGDGIVHAMNVEARIGTLLADVVALAGGYNERAAHLIVGGAMTGKPVATDQLPLLKSTNCILVLSRLPSPARALPCIRCGECAVVCPVRLQPQQLLWYSRNTNESKLGDHGLSDCIECACCDLVCPSHIPLTAEFRKSKRRIRELEAARNRAQHTRQRVEARSRRLRQEEAQRNRELAEQKETARSAGVTAIDAILRRKSRPLNKD